MHDGGPVLAGLTLPTVSAFDPPVAGEGSIDPMGVAAISDRLADILVPGLRARMSRIRFVTAMAIGAASCEPIADEISADETSTPSIGFEWLLIEAFVRRLNVESFPPAIPGSQKCRAVIKRNQRLSAQSYLKGPSVFGFNGVYKPFAVDSGVVDADLQPAALCAAVLRSWEREQRFAGFADNIPGTEGGRLRGQIRDEVRAALRSGRCNTNPGGWLFGKLAASLRPDGAGRGERAALRALIEKSPHETRAELGRHLVSLSAELRACTEIRCVTRRRGAVRGGACSSIRRGSRGGPG